MNLVKESVMETVATQLNVIGSVDVNKLSTKELVVISDDLNKIIDKLVFFGVI